MAAQDDLPRIASYLEPFRSQYHFSPASGWIGDPDGMVYADGTYHLFWWGKATSRDLVHFDQVTIGNCFALIGDPGIGDYYTGSAVIDRENTAGFGKDRMIALYTIPGNPQCQGLSVSTDETYDSLLYYPGNPVLQREGVNDFRDPCVQWDPERNRWLMAIALSQKRQIAFYASDNLRDWTWLSDFGPLGAVEGQWECPDLLRIRDAQGKERWALIVSVSPNREQYFIGDFDGERFIVDERLLAYLTRGTGLDGIVLQDFEDGWGDWTAEGSLADTLPAADTDLAHLGTGYLKTRTESNSEKGSLTSPPFVLEKNAIQFLLGSSKADTKLCIQLLVDGEPVRRSFGDGTGFMKWNGWDVSEYRGRKAQIRILDQSATGFLAVDQIMMTDTLLNTQSEHALWLDAGMDFYASRSFKDVDGTLDHLPLMGWMTNWAYANITPAIEVEGFRSQRGTLSLARDLHLTEIRGLPRLTQTPVAALETLRGASFEMALPLTEGTQPLPGFQPEANQYELEAVFTPAGDDSTFGFELLCGDGKCLRLTYSASVHTLTLERQGCSGVSIAGFSRTVQAPLPLHNGQLKLHLYIDRQSMELFGDDGAFVMTALTFPGEEQTGIRVFSSDDTLLSYRAWMLDSIWPGHIQPRPIQVDDRDPEVVYTGEWTRFGDLKDCLEGSCSYTDDGTVSWTFTGTSVDWYGFLDQNLGIVRVSMDGETVLDALDLYAPGPSRQKLFSKTSLSPGQHTITVRTTGQKNPASEGTGMAHDAFVCLPCVQE